MALLAVPSLAGGDSPDDVTADFLVKVTVAKQLKLEEEDEEREKSEGGAEGGAEDAGSSPQKP